MGALQTLPLVGSGGIWGLGAVKLQLAGPHLLASCH